MPEIAQINYYYWTAWKGWAAEPALYCPTAIVLGAETKEWSHGLFTRMHHSVDGCIQLCARLWLRCVEILISERRREVVTPTAELAPWWETTNDRYAIVASRHEAGARQARTRRCLRRLFTQNSSDTYVNRPLKLVPGTISGSAKHNLVLADRLEWKSSSSLLEDNRRFPSHLNGRELLKSWRRHNQSYKGSFRMRMASQPKTVQTADYVSSERRQDCGGFTISVIICAYTADRFQLLLQSVASVREQTLRPCEIIVCIDHNEPLFHRCAAYWVDAAESVPPIRLIQNKYNGRLGSARNTAAEIAEGEILAFLDDDASAERDWLERLIDPYRDERVGAVGGRPIPVFEKSRPPWYPLQFDWVFGCAYDGLPDCRSPLARLIGANMSVRRILLEQVAGFHSDNHDDMDMCHRVARLKGSEAVIYEPAAIVRHFVPASRLTWNYFWRRCFFVNMGKVEAFARMGDAASLGADTRFAQYALTKAVPREISRAIAGDAHGLARAAAIIAGLGSAAAGHVTGKIKLGWRRSRLRQEAAIPQFQTKSRRPAGGGT